MEKQYNIGLAFLKLWMSFIVIICHYYAGENAFFLMMRNWAVPVYMFIAFLFAGFLYDSRMNTIKKRFIRLLKPYLVWPIIYFIICNIIGLLFDKQYRTGLDNLFWQISFGGSLQLVPQFWYMFDLIILTLFLILFFKICSNVIACKWVFVGILISLFLQYSNANAFVFGGLQYELKWPIGRLVEMYPYAALGALFGYYGIFEKLQANKKYIIFVAIVSLIFINGFPVLAMPESGFNYQGIQLLLTGVFLVIIFYLLPFEKLGNRVYNIIRKISSYSFGVYCVHFLVGRIMNTICENYELQSNTLIECCLIFFVSLLLSVGISKLPWKWCEQIVK